MSIVLLLDVLWICIVTFGGWYGRARIDTMPGGPIGGAIGWLLLVLLGIILIHLLVPGVASYRAVY